MLSKINCFSKVLIVNIRYWFLTDVIKQVIWKVNGCATVNYYDHVSVSVAKRKTEIC